MITDIAVQKNFRKPSFAEAILHLPGQSLQAEISIRLLWSGFVIAIAIVSLLLVVATKQDYWFLLAFISLLIFFRLMNSIKAYWQGMEGERRVREEIEPLLKEGYEIINDLPANGFNIDFVVVGPTGIYVIEVKNPTKRSVNPKVQYQDEQIFINSKPLKHKNPVTQARGNAAWISKLLKNVKNAEITFVKPVILFPEFMVDEYVRDIWIMNPKRFVCEYVKKAPHVLNPQEVQELYRLLRMHVISRTSNPED